MGAIETRTSGLHNTIACLVHDRPFGKCVRTISNTVISATIVGMLDQRNFLHTNLINHPARVSMLQRVTNFLKAWGKLRETPQVLHPTTPDCGGASCYHCGAPGNWKHSRKERPTSRLAAAQRTVYNNTSCRQCRHSSICASTCTATVRSVLRIYSFGDSR